MPLEITARIPGLKYVGISMDRTITFPEVRRTFRVIVYGATESFGLISTSGNGIAVLDVDHLKVYLDGHRPDGFSWAGPSRQQAEEFIRITTMTWPMFLEFVNDHQYARFFMDEDGAIKRERQQPW